MVHLAHVFALEWNSTDHFRRLFTYFFFQLARLRIKSVSLLSMLSVTINHLRSQILFLHGANKRFTIELLFMQWLGAELLDTIQATILNIFFCKRPVIVRQKHFIEVAFFAFSSGALFSFEQQSDRMLVDDLFWAQAVRNTAMTSFKSFL